MTEFENAEALRAKVLQFLYAKTQNDGPRYTNIASIQRGTGTQERIQFLRVLIEDLQRGGLVTASEVGAFGKANILITPKGIDWFRNYIEPSVDSAAWTGRNSELVLSPNRAEAILNELLVVESKLDYLPLSNSEKSQVRAIFSASRLLLEAPEPPSDIIYRLLSRAADLAAVAALLVTALQLTRGGQ